MTSQRQYAPGDIIYSGYPYVQVVRKGSSSCANCCENFHPVKYCQRCGFVRYCSKKCQKEAWPDHKLECVLLKNLPEDRQLMIHLTGLLILKIKGKCWEDIYEVVDGTKVTFAGLLTHFEEMKKDPHLLLYLKEIKALLKTFIGEENLPNDDDLWKIIGKVKYNQFSFGGEPHSPDVYALFLNVSKIDHSCIPNAEFSLQDRKLRIQAIAKIVRGEKIVMSYFPAACYPGSFMKSDAVLKSFFGACQCDDCSKPYGASVLSKILDDSKAYTVVELSENILKMAETLNMYGMLSKLKHEVDFVLKRQEGVLGNTHILRMRVLALKCVFMDIEPLEKTVELQKLLKYMTEAFGEYHREVRKLHGLLYMTAAQGDSATSRRFLAKITKLMSMGFEPIA